MFNFENVFRVVSYNDFVLDHGDGSWVFDTAGNKYLDLNSGQFCLAFGHNDKELQEVVFKQLGKIYHTNTATLTPEVFKACDDMASITGKKLKKTIFLSTGSEANECAYRYSRFITGKNTIVALKNGYHGLTLGSQQLSVGGIYAKPSNASALFMQDFSTDELVKFFDKIFHETNDDIAAVIVEPILGVGGIIVPPDDFFIELRKICTEKNIILIFDECQTGMARTGKWFAYQGIGVEPDILVAAKSIGAGFPISSVTFNSDYIHEVENKVLHFSSHQNDPLACSIVSYVIDRITRDDILNRNLEMGKYILKCLNELAIKHDILENPRGKGLMLGIDFSESFLSSVNNSSKIFTDSLKKEGILLQTICKGKTFRLLPSYVISKSEIDFLIEKLDKVCKVFE